MTFFDKLFTSKNKFFKSDFQSAFACNRSSNGCKKSETSLGEENVRVVVFRECEKRGRKLLFDSDAVEKIGPDCSGRLPNHPDIVEVSATHAFKYKKPNKDISSLGEMIFGSVAICSKGMTFKMHMPSPTRLLLTTVMPTAVRCHPTTRSFSGSPGPGSDGQLSRNLDSKSSSNVGLRRTAASACLKTLSPMNCCEERLIADDVLMGSPVSRRPSDAPSCTSSLSRFSSSASQQGSNSSFLSLNSCSGGSLCSLRRRWNQSLAVSLDQSLEEDGEDSGTRSRTKLGLGVLLNLCGPKQEELKNLILNNSLALESIIERLQAQTSEAYSRVQTFVQTCYSAASSAAVALVELTKTPSPMRFLRPFARVTPPPNSSFVPAFSQLLHAFDSKSTNFFVSSLITALLTHNLSWVFSVASRCQNLNQHTWKETCCNPLWFQHNQLLGATGAPSRGAKIVLTDSQSRQLLTDLIDALAYFLRCWPVIEHQYEADYADITKYTVLPSSNTSNRKTEEEIRKWETEDNFDSGIDCEVQESILSSMQTDRVYEILVNRAATCQNIKFEKTEYNTLKTNEGNFVDKFRTSENSRDCCNSLNGLCSQHNSKASDMCRNNIVNENANSVNSEDISLPITKIVSNLFVNDTFPPVADSSINSSLYPNVASLARMENVRLEDLTSERDRTVFVEEVLRLAETTTKKKCCLSDVTPDEGYQTFSSREDFNSVADVMFQLGDDQLENKGKVVIKSSSLACDVESSLLQNGAIPLATGLSILNRRSRTMEDFGKECPVLQEEFQDFPTEEQVMKFTQENLLFSMFEELSMPCDRAAVKSCILPCCPVLGGISDMLQPHKILQGVKGKAEDVEVEMRRDLARLSAKTALLPIPSQMVYILADLNKWEVFVVSTQHSTLGSPRPIPASPSKLVADMLESFFHLHRHGYSHKFCEDHLERKLQEIYKLSFCVAQMLLENDLCTVDMLTKSLHISANDVPILLSVATTHTPEIAEKYGVTFS